MSITNKHRDVKLKELGWSQSTQSQFFQFAKQIIGENYKGNFTIKQVKGKWFWYFQFSSNKISPRTKYLCSCDKSDSSKQTSFEYATQVYIEKINHQFASNSIVEPLLSKYISEYIDICMKDGGLTYEKRGKSEVVVHTINDNKKNNFTMRRRVSVLSEFKVFCDARKIKTVHISKSEEFRVTIKEYFLVLKNRGKKSRDGVEVSKNKLSRATIKLHMQSIRMFLNWMCKPKSENGRGLLKQHSITTDYQNFLLDDEMGVVQQSQKIFEDFSKENYEKVVGDCQKYIGDIWKLYCKYDGDIEKIREQRLSYNKKLKDGTLSGSTHKNQPKEMVVMSDVVFFVSFIQIAYGTRISEILQSYRNYEIWDEFAENKKTSVSSYFKRVDGNDGGMDYYHLEIRNSKKKNRTIPITDVIYSWKQPPSGVPSVMRERNETDKFDIWETNIVDVIFELFKPTNHAKTFPSPNLNEKPNKGYSNNWYMNLFKSRCVNSDDCNWKQYGIQSTHHLRSYFVSYMFLQDVRVEDVIEITGHSYSTAMGYYRRINTKMMRDTLSHRDLRSILNKNKITNQKSN